MSKHQKITGQVDLPLSVELAQCFQRFSRRNALTVGTATWTYQELWQRAASLAESLAKERGPVALIGTRSILDYAAVLAIFLSGRTYMPLNPSASAGQIGAILDLAKASTVLCARETPLFSSLGFQGCWTTRLIKVSDTKAARPPPESSTYAYVISTSGSTGPPKATPITHSNLAAYLKHARQALDIGPDDRTSQIFDLCFDLSLHDIFVSWLSGAHLNVAEAQDSMDLLGFAHCRKLTVWFSTPSHARKSLLRHRQSHALKNLRLSMFCGEPLSRGLAREWATHSKGRIENWYGPTETTIAATRFVLTQAESQDAGEIVPIGTPIGPFPHAITQAGELCLAGPQVFEGYLGTGAKQRGFFKTGDMVSRDTSGDLRFKHRKDGRVKLNGDFVDLPWIEGQISKVTGLNTTVLPWPPKAPNTTSIVAVLTQGGPLSDDQKARVKQSLPPELPLQLVTLPNLPLTQAGKRDLVALTKQIAAPLARQSRQPRKRYDQLIAFACELRPELLRQDIETAPNLMEAGLDSLAFTAFVAKVEAAFKVTLTQSDVARLSHMTLRQIVSFLRRRLESTHFTHNERADHVPAEAALQGKPHYRAWRTVEFLENFPGFLENSSSDVVPLIGSSGFMRGLDTRVMDQVFRRHGHIVATANIGMAMLSNLGICEVCGEISEGARRLKKRFPLAVLELELLQLSVLPPAGDIEVLKDFKSGAFQQAARRAHDPDTQWDPTKAGTLRERQGPWRPRDAPAQWESRRHAEMRAVFRGEVALDPQALDIWSTAITRLLSVSDHVAVVLHPLDGWTSGIRQGQGHLSGVKRQIDGLSSVSLISDDQFNLMPHHFRNFSHLNERAGRHSFSEQLAHHLTCHLGNRRT